VDGLLVAVVVELVIGSQRRQGSHADTVGEEDLSGPIDPGCALLKFGPVDMDVVS